MRVMPAYAGKEGRVESVRIAARLPPAALGGLVGEAGQASHGAPFAVIMVDEGGLIRECDEAARSWFGYPAAELHMRPLSVILPQLAGVDIIKAGMLNSRLRYLCRLGVRYVGLSRSGCCFNCELFFTDLHNANLPRLRLVVKRSGDDDLWPQLSGRPIHTGN
jgi:PAS domain-containing protein